MIVFLKDAIVGWIKRKRLPIALVLGSVLAWVLYMPIQLYRPWCEVPLYSHRKHYFGPALSERYIESLKYGLDNSGMPYFESGPYIVVPYFHWTDDNAFWVHLNSKTVMSFYHTDSVNEGLKARIQELLQKLYEVEEKDWEHSRRVSRRLKLEGRNTYTSEESKISQGFDRLIEKYQCELVEVITQKGPLNR